MKITKEEAMVCKECGYTFINGVDKIGHLLDNHTLTFKSYILKYYYGNVAPTCKCGCGTELSFKAFECGDWFSEYTKNHWPHKKHTTATKKLIKDGCVKSTQDKYGVDNVFMLDYIKEKSKSTKLEKYGDVNYNNVGKYKQTMILKYGCDNPHKHPILKDRIRLTRLYNFKKYCIDSFNIVCNNDEFDYFPSIESHVYKFTCNVCNHSWETPKYFCPCPKCNKKSRSKIQDEVEYFLENELGVEIEVNTRSIIQNKELDIYIKHLNLAIEINGNYWHSELQGKERNYHSEKLKQCNALGISLINIFEDEWMFKKEIIKRRLSHIIGKTDIEKIYARKCVIKEITSKEKNAFLDEYHIQGSDNSSIYFGAFYGDILVSVMTFGPNRIALGNKAVVSEYELIRFCVNGNVVGVAGKLLTHFIKKYNPSKITSYADKRWVNLHKNIYISLGFMLIRESAPNYWYIHKSDYLTRYHRYSFRKSELSRKLSNFNQSISEWENMKLNGYDRIWDCGNGRFELVCK